jgi:branched-subunit amino acid ABC-type transport system permease component
MGLHEGVGRERTAHASGLTALALPLFVVMNAQEAVNMVAEASVLFLIASGLAVIFGLMNIVNFAHGTFIMVGAYATTEIAAQKLSPWWGIPVGLAVGAGIGIVVECLFMRRLYARIWDTILATIGLGLVFVASVAIIFGRESRFAPAPLTGQLDLGFTRYSTYRIFLIGVALALLLLLSALTRYTRLGLVARAVIADETLASALGIDTRTVRTATFAVGGALAALAGTLVAPIGAVDPNMGENYLIAAFMVVIVAGSSIGGLALGCLIFGALTSWISFVSSQIVGSVVIIVLSAAILRVLPTGFERLDFASSLQHVRAARGDARPT